MKRDKDLRQVELLSAALETTRQVDELTNAFDEAWNRGPHWRKALEKGLSMIAPNIRELFDRALASKKMESALKRATGDRRGSTA
jgi:hypothetical protein